MGNVGTPTAGFLVVTCGTFCCVVTGAFGCVNAGVVVGAGTGVDPKTSKDKICHVIIRSRQKSFECNQPL